MIVLARDVTDPAQSAKPLLMAVGFVTNSDGSTSIQMPDGTAGFTPCYAYQEPNQYGVFWFTPEPIGAYQSCKPQGQLVSFRACPPAQPDAPGYVYTWAELP